MYLTFKYLFKTNVTTTNPGPAPLIHKQFGQYPILDFINFPQIAPPAELGIVYTTLHGELRILTLYDSSCWTKESLEYLVDELWRQVLILSEEKVS